MFSAEYDSIARRLPQLLFRPTPKFLLTPLTPKFQPTPKFYGTTLSTSPTPKFDPRHPHTHATHATHATQAI